MMSTRVVLMISGVGSNAMALIDALGELELSEPIEVVAVGADRDAPGLEGARNREIETFVVAMKPGESRDEWGLRLAGEWDRFAPDLVILSGFMKLLPASLVARYSPRILNTHPAYLPEFPGAHAVSDALAAGVKSTGASVIVVDEGVDTGPILARRRVPIVPGDDEVSLHTRIKSVERELLFDVVVRLSRGETIIQREHGDSDE